ncbi:MAG: TonB-dependent receptor [Dysgonomonas sp.]
MKHFVLSFFLFLLSFSLQAIDIRGRIVDATTKQPIELATIVLLRGDSTYISGSQTDNAGLFAVAGQFSKQDCLLKAAFIGYKTSYIQLKGLASNTDLGDVELVEDSKLLGEVTVTGNRIINKVDRQVIMPDSMQVKSSVTAFDLLSNMAISGLNIDPVNRTVKIRNEDVQLRINGIRATIEEVVALRAQDILRVEYFEDPGVRFGNENVGAVVNLIVQRGKEYGGYVSVDARNAPFVGFGNDNLTFKTNYKDSEFGVNYYLNYRNYDSRWNDKTETLNLPNNVITREQKGVKAPMRYEYHTVNLSYNLNKTDNYVFNAVLKSNIYNYNNYSIYNTFYTNSSVNTEINSHNSGHEYTPVLDLFFRKEMKNKQSVSVNLVGTYIDSKSKSEYSEKENSSPLTDIYNEVNGDKYSFIGEAVYNREFEKLTFSAGLKHTQGYADNAYSGNTTTGTSMKNADSYIFAQIQGKIAGKLGYTLGIGGSRTWFKEGDRDATFYALRPSLQMNYPINDYLSIKYSFSVNTRTPSLGQLSDVEQQSDRYLINRGNPNVKPYNAYRNNLSLSLTKGIISATSTFGYFYFPKLFTYTYTVEDNMIVSSLENHKAGYYYFWTNDLSVKIIKDIWTVNGTLGMHHDVFKGNTREGKFDNMYGNFQSNLQYKGYSLLFGSYQRYKELWGESVYKGEIWSYVEAGYKYKEAKIALGMSLPFESRWSMGTENRSLVMPSKSWTYISQNGRMLYLRFSWNTSFGRKYEAGKKNLDNADNDKGVL